MVKVYGSMMCPDCVACAASYKEHQIDFEFYDFKDSLLYIKEFLKIRDTYEIFDEVRENEKIGIPCVVKEDGTVLLDWQSLVDTV